MSLKYVLNVKFLDYRNLKTFFKHINKLPKGIRILNYVIMQAYFFIERIEK
jgi:hypothetical protein